MNRESTLTQEVGEHLILPGQVHRLVHSAIEEIEQMLDLVVLLEDEVEVAHSDAARS
jgi:hypothetical protein